MRTLIYWTVLLYSTLAWAQHPCPNQLAKSKHMKAVDCSGGDCALPIATAAEIYSSMDNAIIPIGHDGFGFPVNVLAASYGLQDPGWKIALRPWRFRKARIEDALRSLKRYSGPQADLPTLIAVNLPRLGSRFYDAGFIRLLFWTDLFPSNPKIIRLSNADTNISYVLLNPDKAREAKKVFKQRSDQPCTGTNSLEDSTLKQLAFLVDGSSGLDTFGGLLYSLPTSTPPQRSQALASPDTLPHLPSENGYWVRITFEPNHWLCGRWGELQLMQEGDLKGLTNFFGKETGCFLKMQIELPKGTNEGYREITIAGKVMGDRFACSPQDFGGKSPFVDAQKCPSVVSSSAGMPKPMTNTDSDKPKDIKWTITQDGLRGGRTEKLTLAISDTVPEPKVLISLWGDRIDPGAEGIASCWCGGSGRSRCEPEELDECRVLPIK